MPCFMFIKIHESYVLYLLWFNACLSVSVSFPDSKKKNDEKKDEKIEPII